MQPPTVAKRALVPCNAGAPITPASPIDFAQGKTVAVCRRFLFDVGPLCDGKFLRRPCAAR